MMFSQSLPRKAALRARAERIREVAKQFTQTARTVSSNLVSFATLESIEPHYTQLTDSELESFLRRNQLLPALREYLESHTRRSACTRRDS